MTHPNNTSSNWPSSLCESHTQDRKSLFDKVLPVYRSMLIEEKIPENETLIETLENLYIPFCQWLSLRQKDEPLIIGINGSQGSGKSTLTKILSSILKTGFNKKVVSLSLDDLYKTKEQRHTLSMKVHPLLSTRGVPGTHDIKLGKSILNHLKNKIDSELLIPAFDKSIDDRLDKSNWKKINNTCDIILFEGWCVGSTPQQEENLQPPVNELEKEEDPKGTWREYVNNELKSEYKDLFSMIDILVMLEIPDFEKVYEWRNLQEEKLKASLSNPSIKKHSIMNEKEIKHFIMHYERISRHTLNEMPERADIVMSLGEDHQIKNVITRNLV